MEKKRGYISVWLILLALTSVIGLLVWCVDAGIEIFGREGRVEANQVWRRDGQIAGGTRGLGAKQVNFKVKSEAYAGGAIGAGNVRAHCSLLDVTPQHTRFAFELGDIAIEHCEIGEKTYSKVVVEEMWYGKVKGKPSLPVMRMDFAVAGGWGKVKIVSCEEERVKCAPPVPSAGLGRIDKDDEFEEDKELYNSAETYPGSLVSMGEGYIFRGIRGNSLSIQPARYDFGTGELVVTRHFEAEVTTGDESAEDCGTLSREWNLARLQQERFVNQAVLVKRGNTAYQTGRCVGGIMLVVLADWQETLEEFIAWKRQCGYEIVVARYPEDTGTGARKLKAAVKAAYDAQDITHVVLCGDWRQIPPGEVSARTDAPGEYPPTTDNPYAWLDGDDVYADVFISRLTAETKADLSAICGKIIAYEKNREVDEDWRRKGIFVASHSRGSYGFTKNKYDYELVDANCSRLLNGGALVDAVRVYAPSVSPYQHEMAIMNEMLDMELQSGASLVYYLGHGESNKWFTADYYADQAMKLNNGNSLPWIASFACSTANFAYDGRCLGTEFVRNAHGGAVGFWGATSDTYWNPPITSMNQLTEDILGQYGERRLTHQGAYALSAHQSGIDYLMTTTDKYQGTAEYYSRQMHLLGDGSALGRLAGGRQAAVTMDKNGKDGLQVKVVWTDSAEPVPGAIVCAHDAEGTWFDALRTDVRGTAAVHIGTGNTRISVVDASFGCLEYEYTSTVPWDIDGDGNSTDAEIVAYLEQHPDLPKETLEELVADWRANTAETQGTWSETRHGASSQTAAVSEYRVQGNSNAVVDRLLSAGLSIMARRRDSVEVTGGDNTLEVLNKLGLTGEKITDSHLPTRGNTAYWSAEDLNAHLERLCLEHWDICRPEYVGRSVEGREILAVRVSRVASSDRDCPEYLLTGGIHGNERTGTWVAVAFLEHLLELSRDEAWEGNDWLEHCAIWIVPMMNPDGASAMTRTNAKGHDLNRSYPDGALQDIGTFAEGSGMGISGMLPTMAEHGGETRFPATEVLETTAFMRFCMPRRFVAALHFHSGSLVVCYPYGNNKSRKRQETPSPDDSVFQALAAVYSQAYDGTLMTVNSANWYPVDGELPDWMYRYLGTLAMTVELSENYEESTEEALNGVWNRHCAALMAWLKCVVTQHRKIPQEQDNASGLTVDITPSFTRFVPNAPHEVVADVSAFGSGRHAYMLTWTVDTGLSMDAFKTAGEDVIGSRTESGDGCSMLVYGTEPTAGIVMELSATENDANQDHVFSCLARWAGGAQTVCRRQVVLAERRGHVLPLGNGWSMVSSPVVSETVAGGEECVYSIWTGSGWGAMKPLHDQVLAGTTAVWVYSPKATEWRIEGWMRDGDNVLTMGWNLTGPLWHQPADGTVYRLVNGMYVAVKELVPGNGYWIYGK